MSLFEARRWETAQEWLNAKDGAMDAPLYSSVDIRDAGFKAAVVDTNLFPAGFNNICGVAVKEASGLLRHEILQRVPQCQKILIIAEEHTRNTWYLENLRILKQMLDNEGFESRVVANVQIEPVVFDQNIHFVELTTATGQPLKVYHLKPMIAELTDGSSETDLILLNNDLIQGVPDFLRQVTMPVYPSPDVGWHTRLKSQHFMMTQGLGGCRESRLAKYTNKAIIS